MPEPETEFHETVAKVPGLGQEAMMPPGVEGGAATEKVRLDELQYAEEE